jgi:iron complex transport system ATP-binding protein
MNLPMHSMNLLSTRRLSLGYNRASVIIDLDLAIPAGKVIALVGANGCGKSTLLRGLARLLQPRAGTVYLDGAEIFKLSTEAVAKRLGILPQGPVAPAELTVRDLVAQGRYPYQNWLHQWSKEDERMVEQALVTTGMTHLAGMALT